MTEQDAHHLRLLRILKSNPGISQRQLAVEFNVSFGKTKYLLSALLQKGLVKTENFHLSDNKLAYLYLYLLTPHGITENFRLELAPLV